LSAFLLSLIVTTACAKKPTPPVVATPTLEEATAQLIGRALVQDNAYEELVHLSDRIGNRLAGSEPLAEAVEWARQEMEKDGLVATTEPVMVPAWIRGEESITALAPIERPLNMLGLGNSIGTPAEGIEADVLVVDSFDHLDELGDTAKGKIVLFDVPFTDYGSTVAYRGGGADAASKHGAVAALVRSVTPKSLDTPHTGAMGYRKEGVEKIPTAAITVEDASWMRRLSERGQTVRVQLKMQAHFEDDRESHNVIGEVLGRELPDEIIVVGCHLDSWDVGQGAQDDGAGCVAAMEAVRLIATMPGGPKRTVRAVLFTNEENGLRGGKAYAEAHPDETFIAALEADTGAGQPFGWRVDLQDHTDAQKEQTIARLQDILVPLLDPVGAGKVKLGGSGADISPITKTGVPGFGVWHDMTDYWPIHHTQADTVDKVDPQLLNRTVASMAVLGWLLSEQPESVLP